MTATPDDQPGFAPDDVPIPYMAIRVRGAKYNGGAKFYSVYDGDTSKPHDLRISHIAYDRVHTSADDSGTWFPLPQLHLIAREGRIGEVAPALLRRAHQP